MKKGFTMIELIFVIVILGILASVAVPRLAGTKADAEESAAVANLRTLVSDLNTYYVAKGEFPAADTKWSEITNVPLSNTSNTATTETKLKVGGKECIGVQFVAEKTTVAADSPAHPAYIKFTKDNTNSTNSSVCQKVREAEPIKAYTKSEVIKGLPGTMPIGSMCSGSSVCVATCWRPTCAVI